MPKKLTIAAVIVGALVTPAAAQDFPTKPISVVIGFGAGGGTDAIIRAVSEPMSKSLGQPVLVTNKPGAGGGVAAMDVKAAKPDGYSLVASGSLTFTFEPQVLKAQYNHKDFTHLALISLFQDGLFTHPSRPYKTMRDVINAAKTEKRSIKYASQYQLDRMIFAYVAKQEGVEIIPVPTQGGNGSVTATLANQVDFGFSGGTFGPYVESGQLRIIGAMSAEPMERFPDIPGMKGNGWNIGSENFIIVSAPKGTPKPIVDKLATTLKAGMATEPVQATLKSRYIKQVWVGPDEIDAALQSQVDKFAKLIAEQKSVQ